MEGRVVRISIAPVKALHLVHPDEVELTHAGVAGDRRFWLVDRDGGSSTARRIPQLMRVQPEWDEATRQARARVPGRRASSTVTVEPGEPVEAELYGTPHPSRAVPGPWQEALSELRRGAADAALVGAEARSRPRKRPRRLRRRSSLAARSSGWARRPARRSRSTAAASGCCSRSTASSRTRRTTGSAVASRSGTQ